jgi:hypothetical protein
MVLRTANILVLESRIWAAAKPLGRQGKLCKKWRSMAIRYERTNDRHGHGRISIRIGKIANTSDGEHLPIFSRPTTFLVMHGVYFDPFVNTGSTSHLDGEACNPTGRISIGNCRCGYLV